MKKNRISMIIWILFALAVYIIWKNNLVLIALGITIVVPIISFGISFFGSNNIRISISGPEMLSKGERGEVFVNCSEDNFSKLCYAYCVITQENLYNGEFFSMTKELKNFEMSVESEYLGKIKTSIEAIKVMDKWGLISVKRPVLASFETDVIPDLFRQEIITGRADSVDLESVEYSVRKPGDDPSEIFDIREYQTGDSLKKIHWKLSSKYDQLMVMRPSMPIDSSVLLIFDTTLPKDGTEDFVQGKAADNMAEVFFSLSRNLIATERKHTVATISKETGQLTEHQVYSHSDFAAVLSDSLKSSFTKQEKTAYEMYEEIPNSEQFAHVVVCGLRDDLVKEHRGSASITKLIAKEDYEFYKETNSMRQIHFSDNYASELFHIII